MNLVPSSLGFIRAAFSAAQSILDFHSWCLHKTGDEWLYLKRLQWILSVCCGHCLTRRALTTRRFKYPSAGPYQGPAEHSCVEIQLISGEGSLDPHGESARWRPNSLKSNQPHNIRPDCKQHTHEVIQWQCWGWRGGGQWEVYWGESVFCGWYFHVTDCSV